MLTDSIVDGPLSKTSAYLAKISTSPMAETPNYQHVMCLYMPDVYDETSVKEASSPLHFSSSRTHGHGKVMTILLRNHGLNLSGVKSDLYTLIGQRTDSFITALREVLTTFNA
jgi:hypothetical protein